MYCIFLFARLTSGRSISNVGDTTTGSLKKAEVQALEEYEVQSDEKL